VHLEDVCGWPPSDAAEIEDVEFDRIAGGTVYLMARNPFEATELEQTFGKHLLAYWRLCRPNVAKLRALSLSADAKEAAPAAAAGK